MSKPPPRRHTLIAVDEAAFTRRVRAATVPVVVAFRSPRCAACRALLPDLARLAAQYADEVIVLGVDVERTPFVAEQYGVTAVPTVLVVRDGEEVTRMVGFGPEPLLRLLFDQVVGGNLPPGLWSPTEQAFEDAVIIPLLDSWGWTYRRQVVCPPHAGGNVARGRVDILAYGDALAEPLTLFEAKRHIASSASLQRAVAQAHGYAEALDLASFVIAAPAGLWIYRLDSGRSRLMQVFSSLEVAIHPEIVKQALHRIRRMPR